MAEISSEDRATKLEAIAAQIRACQDCRLYANATNAVPGYGDTNADILFIGEAPGQEEDRQGLPFVGRSGKYLDYLLELIGMRREQVFIANMVKHRPPDNRDPLADEIEACRHFLDAQFAIIDPRVIVTLGRFSMEYYLGSHNRITRVHGKPVYRDGRAFYPMYHPAAALRNANLRWDMEDDIKRIPEIIEEVNRRRVMGEMPGQIPPDTTPESISTQDDEEPPQQLSLF